MIRAVWWYSLIPSEGYEVLCEVCRFGGRFFICGMVDLCDWITYIDSEYIPDD